MRSFRRLCAAPRRPGVWVGHRPTGGYAPAVVEIRCGGPDDFGAVLAVWAEAGAEPTVTDDNEALRALLGRDPEAQLVARGARRLAVFAVTGEPGAASFWRALGYQEQPDRLRLVKNVAR